MSADANEVNYIFVDNLGLVTYRFTRPDGAVQEFDNLEEGLRFAAANAVYEIGVVFPDGDVRWIPLQTGGMTNDDRRQHRPHLLREVQGEDRQHRRRTRDDEERTRRHQGNMRRLRHQEVSDWGVNFNGPVDCGQPELRRPVHQVVSAGETRPRNP